MNWLKRKNWNMFASGAALMLMLWEIYLGRYSEAGVSLFFAVFFLAK